MSLAFLPFTEKKKTVTGVPQNGNHVLNDEYRNAHLLGVRADEPLSWRDAMALKQGGAHLTRS